METVINRSTTVLLLAIPEAVVFRVLVIALAHLVHRRCAQLAKTVALHLPDVVGRMAMAGQAHIRAW